MTESREGVGAPVDPAGKTGTPLPSPSHGSALATAVAAATSATALAAAVASERAGDRAAGSIPTTPTGDPGRPPFRHHAEQPAGGGKSAPALPATARPGTAAQLHPTATASPGRPPAVGSARESAAPVLGWWARLEAFALDWFGWLRIRETLGTPWLIGLGLMPVLTGLIMWQRATTGEMVDVDLPAGRFEGEPAIAAPVEPASPPTPPTPASALGRGAVGRAAIASSAETQPPAALPAPEPPARRFTAGARFDEKTWLYIPGATLRMTDDGNELTCGGQAYEIWRFSLPARTLEHSVRLELPPGRLVFRDETRVRYRFENVESRRYSPAILPSLGEIARSAHDLWVPPRNLPGNLLVSFRRVTYGFLIALAVCFPLGVLMGTFTKLDATFAPTSVFLAYLPIPALAPLTLMFWGMSETQKYMYLALAFGIFLLPLFVQAISKVDNVFLQTAYTLGANRFQAMVRVLLAIALPDMVVAMRLGFGIGWGYIMLAEMVDMTAGGVGAMILVSQRQGPREHVFLILLAIVVVAFVTDLAWKGLEWVLFPYRREKR